tara:strand:- start:681 stop:989 length:309 start_codon:yes stop_codon:yes gene_type:complete
MEIDEHSYFYAGNGNVLKNLDDLLKFLNSVNEETFFEHVNSDKNDLANWVRDVLKEKRLSNKLSKTRNRDDMAVFVEERLDAINDVAPDRKSVISKLVEAIG